jgi:D-psicose/D-tagatose/L-ribulose 3-epimerase
MKDQKYLFPLSIQLTLPEDYRSAREFKEQLSLLQEFGFSAVELNIERPEDVDQRDLVEFLDQYGLSFTMFASGVSAKALGLSLSHEDPQVRRKTVEKSRQFIEFAQKMEVGIIVGFLQGGPAQDVEGARRRFRETLAEIAPYAQKRRVALIIETVNRYISSVTVSLENTYELIKEYRGEYVRMLPDTFHMNIEEADMYSALKRCAPFYDSIHYSDNNRFCPGLGAIDFKALTRFLVEIGYMGGIAIEAEIKKSFAEDLKESMAYLQPILEG